MSYFNFFRAHDQFMPQHFRFRSGGFMMPRGGNVSITENINIKNGPSGFWGFMTGLSQGLFGGGMGYGMGMGGSIFGCPSMPMMGMGMPMMGTGMMSPYAMLNGAVTPQGTTQTEEKTNNLTQLRNLFKSKNVTIEETKPGKFTATDSKGNIIGRDLSFEEMTEKLGNSNRTDGNPDVETETDAQRLAKKQKEAADKNDPPLEKVGNDWVSKADHSKKFKWNGTGFDPIDEEHVEPEVTSAKVKPEELKNGVNITVIDEVWDAEHPNEDGHITGKTELGTKKSADGFSETITVAGKRYQLQNDKVDGDPVYKSLDGDGDTYRLSKKDGQLVLIQSASDKDKLSGVGTTDIHRT